MFHRNVTKLSASDTTSCATRHETSLTLLEGRRLCCLWIWRKIRQWPAFLHTVYEAFLSGETVQGFRIIVHSKIWYYIFLRVFRDTKLPIYTFILYTYTGCPRRNVLDFGRLFIMLKYTDITQKSHVHCWTVTEIMAREKCRLLAGPRTVPVSWKLYPCPFLSVLSYYGISAHAHSKLLMYFLLGDKAVHVSAWHSCHV